MKTDIGDSLETVALIGPAVLVCVDKGLGTRPVNQPWDAGGERVDSFHGILRENCVGVSSIGQLLFNVGFRLGEVIRGQEALDVNPVENGPVCVQLQLFPEFSLSGQNQRKGIFRVHSVVEQKTDFFQHLFGEKMAFIHNHHQLSVLHAPHNFNLVVQQISGIAPVEPRFTSQLFQ